MSEVRLVPLPREEYDRWWSWTTRDYAAEHVRAGLWSEDEALANSEAEFRELLPRGTETPGHYLFSLEDPATREHVGLVWFRADRGPGAPRPPTVFLYDLVVYEPFRGRGHGTRAMHLVEERARELGFETIALHVFAHNEVALSLYRKLGYLATDIRMAKKVGDPVGPGTQGKRPPTTP
jgi:ribosomal protein S18 acetylase RimI-like enzyme